MSTRVCLVTIVVSGLVLAGCAEVTSDHIIGEPGFGFWVSDTDSLSAPATDTLFFDRAEKLEGLWVASWLSEEDDQLYFIKHAGPARLRIAWTHWNGESFSTTETEAVVSTLDGQEYLNMHPVYDEGVADTSRYWLLRLWSGEDKVMLMVPDYDLLEEAVNAGTIQAAQDTSEDSRIHIFGKESLDAYIVANGRLAWDDVDYLILRRILQVPGR